MQKQIKQISYSGIISKIIIAGLLTMLLLSFAFIESLLTEQDIMNSKMKIKEMEYENIINTQNAKIFEMNIIITNLDTQLKKVGDINKSYVDEITNLQTQVDSYTEELQLLRSRSELYDKYEYAIIDTISNNGQRTELKYAEIQYAEDLMIQMGLNPHLMFGTIMVESNGRPDAVNPVSGATGYGQFLDSSAEWVWTNILGNEGYYPDIRKDGMANITLIAGYYDYLCNDRGKPLYEAIKEYSGNRTDEGTNIYISKLNNYTSTVGAFIN